METPYDEEYYGWLTECAVGSARVIVPLVLDLVQPKSVVDVGCGVGAWPAVFREHGVEEAWGVDGDWVDTKALRIPREHFVEADLNAPLDLGRRFDLVVSLEVAEHLDEANAVTFVETLTRHGPVVLFSAAVPDQGGASHVNEQWPAYWVEHFRQQGYAVADPFRRAIWEDDRVAWWYTQNVFLFVREDRLGAAPRLQEEVSRTPDAILPVVHPRLFALCHERVEAQREHGDKLWAWAVGLEEEAAALRTLPVRKVLRALPGRVVRTLTARVRSALAGKHAGP